MNIKPYFWDLSKAALAEAEKILRNPVHPKFVRRMITLLSRCNKPKEVFGLINRQRFVDAWPNIRKEWNRIEKASEFCDWWETIYEQVSDIKPKAGKGSLSRELKRVGELLRGVRLAKGWSQADLALRVGLKQPDISALEKGKKNVTFQTLIRVGSVLGIKELKIKCRQEMD